jgi:hypothetical protein
MGRRKGAIRGVDQYSKQGFLLTSQRHASCFDLEHWDHSLAHRDGYPAEDGVGRVRLCWHEKGLGRLCRRCGQSLTLGVVEEDL